MTTKKKKTTKAKRKPRKPLQQRGKEHTKEINRLNKLLPDGYKIVPAQDADPDQKTTVEQLRAIQKLIPPDCKVIRVPGMGRPPSYKPEYCQMLIEHMAQGFNFETFAANLKFCSISHIYGWLDQYPEFLEARKIGEGLSYKWWLNLGRGAAAGQVPGFNSAAWIFSMKNIFKWRDKHDINANIHQVKEIVHTVQIGDDGDITQVRNVITEGN